MKQRNKKSNFTCVPDTNQAKCKLNSVIEKVSQKMDSYFFKGEMKLK